MKLLHRIQNLDASRRLDVVSKYIPALLVEQDEGCDRIDGNSLSMEQRGILVGHIHSDLVETIRNHIFDERNHVWKDSFLLPPPATPNSSIDCQNSRFFGLCVQAPSPQGDTRTAAFERFSNILLECNVIPKLHNDLYPITDLRNGGGTIAIINRNAAPFLGISSVGVHLLCYVRENDTVSLWLAQRAADKSHNALRWDPTVAGGQPASMSLFDNLIKEAGEEAGIDPTVVSSNAIPTGCLSQMTCKANGTCMKQSLYYTWDMEVDRESFVPHPADGEVETFRLFSAEELEDEVRTGDLLRPAMILVITDFLIRHGVITPDNEPDYAEILAAMHRERLVL